MARPENALAARRILIAEDEAIVALDFQLLFEDLGARVMGPCATVRGALRAVESSLPDAAVLDVMLADGEVYELADLLHERGVCLLFHSGHAECDALARRYPGAAICPKPAAPDEIESTLAALVAREGAPD